MLGIVVVALGLRLYLAAQGGALFWTDEKRYLASREAVGEIIEGDGAGAARFLLGSSDHIGFRWLALFPAALERAIFGENVPHARLCAGFFALFSAANLFLVWRIARRVSDDERGALLALAFAASSNTLFFFSRHCLPYDASLLFFLWAVLISVGPVRPRQSLRVGALCALGYLTYNGYWLLGAAILTFHVLWPRGKGESGWRRTLEGAAGLVAPLLVVVVAARLAGYDLIADARSFAGTVNQGDFGRGWRLALDYLPVADGVLLPVGLVAWTVAGVSVALCRREAPAWLRWAGMSLLFLGLGLLLSDVVYKFVLYGRTVRAVVPFLALAAGGAAGHLLRIVGPAGRAVGMAVCAGLCLAGVWQMREPLRQVFPVDFRMQAEQVKAEVRQREPSAVLQTLFAEYLFGYDFPESPPPHREILRRTHPQHYLPYLYEGYRESQRPRYMGHDTAMRVIQLDTSRGLHRFKKSSASQWLAPYPGPLRIRLRLPVGRTGTLESLVLHGERPENQDRLTVQYLDAARIRLGFQHGAAEPQWSAPLGCDFAQEHSVLVSFGSFYPAAGDARFENARSFEMLTSRLFVRFDDTVVFNQPQPATAAPLAELRLGGGIPAHGTIGPFSGEVLSVPQIDPRAAVDGEWLPETRGESCFPDFPGPIELLLRFPKDAVGRSQPLISTGKTGAGDLLFVTYEDETSVSFGLDHWGGRPVHSKPMKLEAGKDHRLVISLGSLFPPGDRMEYGWHPGLAAWSRRLLVRVDDETVLTEEIDFYPGPRETVAIGRCDTGATSAEKLFTGQILAQRSLSPLALGLSELGRASAKGPFFGDYPGTVEMELRFPPILLERAAEPLVASGRPGAGDQLFVRYLDQKHIVIELDHWGTPSLESAPVEVSPGSTHRLIVSMGSLFPPQDDARYLASPHLRLLRKWLFVSLDGKALFSQPFQFFPAEPDAVWFGCGLRGSGSVGAGFTGQMSGIWCVSPEGAGLEERTLRGPRIEGAMLPGGFPGAIRLTVQMPQAWVPTLEPLVIAGDLPEGDLVFIKYRGAKRIQFGFRHGLQPPVWSASVPSEPGKMHTVDISLGSLFPPADSYWREAPADQQRLRQRARIAADGRVVLDVESPLSAPSSRSIFLGVNPTEAKGVWPAFLGKILRAQTIEPTAASR